MKFSNPISTERLLELSRTSERVASFVNIGAVQSCQLLDVLDLVVAEAVQNKDGSLKYAWNDLLEFPAPGGKLQWYTKAGTCIYGKACEFSPGFVTHWANLLPSPEKQNGGIK